MKSKSIIKSTNLLVLVVLFIFSANVNAQISNIHKNEEKTLQLKSLESVNEVSKFNNVEKRKNFAFEQEGIRAKLSSINAQSKIQKDFSFRNSMAIPTDSAYIYNWADDDWQFDIRLFYYPNSTGYETIQEAKKEGAWVKRFKREYVYYQSNVLKSEVYSIWKNSTQEWINDETTKYNEVGLETEYFVKIWNDTTQKFIDGIRAVSQYENDTNLIEDVYQRWDTVSSSWDFVFMVENVYNNSGLITSSTEKTYDKNKSQWENSYVTKYGYNQYKELAEETWQYWDTVANKWANDVKIFRYYDNDIGKLSEQVVQVWDTVASDWQNNNKRIVNYNDFFQLETIQNKIWDIGTESWTDTTRATYVYTDLGDILSYLEEAWDGETWINTYEEEYTYNNQNYLTDVILKEWDTENDQWENYAAIYYVYDATEGFLKSRRDEYWNPNTDSWETDRYIEIAIIANGLDYVEYYDKEWNDTLNKFTEGYRQLYTYYANGQTEEVIIQEWDTISSSWVNDQKVHYFWSAALPVENIDNEQISIYPVPFRNSLNIELPENILNTEIEIYNVQGQKIESLYLDRKETAIDLSKLKNGVYFIVYDINNRKFIKKVVKQ